MHKFKLKIIPKFLMLFSISFGIRMAKKIKKKMCRKFSLFLMSWIKTNSRVCLNPSCWVWLKIGTKSISIEWINIFHSRRTFFSSFINNWKSKTFNILINWIDFWWRKYFFTHTPKGFSLIFSTILMSWGTHLKLVLRLNIFCFTNPFLMCFCIKQIKALLKLFTNGVNRISSIF